MTFAWGIKSAKPFVAKSVAIICVFSLARLIKTASVTKLSTWQAPSPTHSQDQLQPLSPVALCEEGENVTEALLASGFCTRSNFNLELLCVAGTSPQRVA